MPPAGVTGVTLRRPVAGLQRRISDTGVPHRQADAAFIAGTTRGVL
jgi:hypothetical protein